MGSSHVWHLAWLAAGVAFLVGPRAVRAADHDYAAYEKLDTAAGWVEFLSGSPAADDLARAQRSLANSLSRDPKTGVKLGPMTSLECRGGSISQTELISHIRTVGSSWKWFCEKGSFTYTVNNPTSATIFVRGSAHGLPIDVVVPAGKTVSGTLTMTSPCDTNQRQGAHRFAPGRVTFTCSSNLALRAAAVVKDELTSYSDLLQTRDGDRLRRFLATFPKSLLAEFAKDRLADVERASLDGLRKQLRTSVALGPAPAKLVDPRPYTLTIENPTDQSLTVTVKHESSDGEDVAVGAKAKATMDLHSTASAPPKFSIVGVSLASP